MAANGSNDDFDRVPIRGLPWFACLISLAYLGLIGCDENQSTSRSGAGHPRAEGVNPASPRPNIVLILSDDQGWADFGFMGSEIVETPHIDSLAEFGFRFSLAFNTASVCRASLRSILTG